MAETSRGLLFRKRNVLGIALVAGIGVGVWLGKLPGIGNGGSGFFGFGQPQGNPLATTGNNDEPKDLSDTSDSPATIVKVVIDEHQYLLKSDTKETPISLTDLIELVKKTPGDADGLRLRIYEKSTARAKAEEDLKAALANAGIPNAAVFWVPSAAE